MWMLLFIIAFWDDSEKVFCVAKFLYECGTKFSTAYVHLPRVYSNRWKV